MARKKLKNVNKEPLVQEMQKFSEIDEDIDGDELFDGLEASTED